MNIHPDHLIGVVHDLKVPLAIIDGYANMLLLKPDMDREKLTGIGERIQKCTKDMVSLVNGILEPMKDMMELVPASLERFCLHELFKEVLDLHGDLARLKGLSLNVDLDWNATPSSVTTDRRKLKQILSNLLDNAIKFTSKGTVSLHSHYRADTKQLHIEVSDTGAGIPHLSVDHIFAPFYQVNPESRKISGFGIGLAHARANARSLGGDVNLKSTGDHGSTFEAHVKFH